MKQTFALAVALGLACSAPTFAQTSVDNMDMATLNEKMNTLGDEMNVLGKEMESYGKEMEKYGQELEKNAGRSPQAEKQMNDLGEKMNRLGAEMGKLGEQMGQYGERMGELHRQMINWFFRELKKDGLIASLNGKTRVIFDAQGLDIDGKKASAAQFAKYKAGFEKYWGRPLKTDFLFFYKGTIEEKEGKIVTEGNLNTDF
jgi:hypothetical protein